MYSFEYEHVLNKSILKIRIPEEKRKGYQYQMILQNKIAGTVFASEQKTDEEYYLCFDVSSMQSISSLFKANSMRREELRDICERIKREIASMEEFLLPGNSLILDANLVFRDMDSGEYRFLLYPGGGENENPFPGFLISVIDHEQEELTQAVYEAYADRESGAWLDKLLAATENEIEEKQEKISETDIMPLKGTTKTDVVQNEKQEILWDPEKKKNGLFAFGIVVVTLVVAIVELVKTYILTTVEIISTILGVLAVLILSAIGILFYVNRAFLRKIMHKRKKQETSQVIETRWFEQDAKDTDFTKTCFIEPEEPEYKLYGTGKKNKESISLESFPLRIGRDGMLSNVVIEDNSISRMHAVFYKENGKLLLEDLNSTNGTYKNGIRLIPSAPVEILPDDEISFGNLPYIYR